MHTHHFKTTFMCPRSIAEVPSGRALPDYHITAHHLYEFLIISVNGGLVV